MIRAGLVFFVVVTALASLVANIAYEMANPFAPGQVRLIAAHWTWLIHTIFVAAVTLPAVLIMMLSAWRGIGRPLLVGLLAVVVVAGGWSLANYLDMALSPNAGKRAQQLSALSDYLVGLACIVPAYLAAYALLRRLLMMRPLLAER